MTGATGTSPAGVVVGARSGWAGIGVLGGAVAAAIVNSKLPKPARTLVPLPSLAKTVPLENLTAVCPAALALKATRINVAPLPEKPGVGKPPPKLIIP